MAIKRKLGVMLGGWTQRRLASAIKISPSYMSQLCSGTRPLSMRVARALAKTLRRSIDDVCKAFSGGR